MLIGTRAIGPDDPPYIIAEIGVNHDGSPGRALDLTRLAARAGADAVKFQFFEAHRLMSRAAALASYQRRAGERDPLGMLRRLELTIDALAPCVAEAHRLGVHAIVSVFSVELVAIARGLPWDAYKTASPDIINRPLLEALADTGMPLIVSTGAGTIAEVERAVGWLAGARGRLALMQCVSAYPTPADAAAIGGMDALNRAFPGGPVGYSDHTVEVDTGAVAVAAPVFGRGACLLEKHFTDDRGGKGPDHAASLDPDAFARYAALARGAFAGRGSPGHGPPLDRIGPLEKAVLPVEEDVRRVSRQSLTTTRDLPAGHVLARPDLTIKRPGTGLPPYELASVLGRRLSRAVTADMPLNGSDLA
jgi:N,N'-diacetyllegionaminate synthase